MRIRGYFQVGRELLVWAAWYNGAGIQHLGKRGLVSWLRGQMEMFGTDLCMGESAGQDMEEDPEGLRAAEALITKWFPSED